MSDDTIRHEHEPLTYAPEASGVSDQDLLREYAATRSESAFALLVKRHLGLVYSSALRQTGQHATAQDIAQAVFIILSRKAEALRRETVLAGWLFRAVRYAALDARKMEVRRQAREEEAARMHVTDAVPEGAPEWEQLSPVLDEAITSLPTKDRHAVLLRFFEKKSFGEVAAVLGGNENAARVRVVRALEKLRRFFRKRGIIVSAVALSGALLTNAAQAAPPTLASLLKGGGTATATSLVQTVLRRLLWERVIRFVAAVALVVLLASIATVLLISRPAARSATMPSASLSLRDTIIAIDRAYTLNDPDRFVALIHFRNPEEEQFRPVLANYIRAESQFRQQMRRKFNVQQRTFDATFRELCVGQPPVRTNYIGADRAATNVMIAKYPFHLVKVAGTWKWDLLSGLSREVRDERRAVLQYKTQLLETLAREVEAGASTNVAEILQRLQSAAP